MNLIEKGYLYKIKYKIDEFIELHHNSKDMTAILYTAFLIEKLYRENPMDDSCCTNDTIFKASLSLKIYKVVRETEIKITEIFGENKLIETLLASIFEVIDFE